MMPNRITGNWLPKVETCPNRAVPCGNPLCADEAMRAGQIEAGSNGFLAGISVANAMSHAGKIAKSCNVPQGECPLEICYGKNRHSALEIVKNSVK